MEYKNIMMDIEGKIAVLSFNRPKFLNSMSMDMKHELDDALTQIAENDHIWGVIITGAGRAFCAGTDISEFPDNVEETRNIVVMSQAIMNKIENLDKPVIAAINGYALGGGLELALACDIRVASEKAKMGLVEVTIGAMPCYGGTQRLTRLIGPGKAKELIFSGRQIPAAEAYDMGIVNHVVPAGEELAKAKEIMEMILQNAPLSVAYSKISINRGMEVGQDYAMHLEQHLVSMLVATEDLKEGSRAFLEKRKPVYQKH